MKKLLLVILIVSSRVPISKAQHELTLFHMNNVFQSSYVNLTSVPEQKLSIGLPFASSSSFAFTNSSWRANDFKTKTARGVDTLILDKAIGKMSRKNNYLYGGLSTDLFSIRVKVRNIFVGFNITENANARFTYPQDLFKLINKGNAQFIGKEANFNGIGINASHYREYGISFIRAKEGSKFIYGGRLKLLQGISNVYTSRSNASVKIKDQIYQHSLAADLEVNTSGFANVDQDFANNYASRSNLMNFKNRGYGLDLGVTYLVNNKISITGALNNLGYIKWKSNLKTYAVHGQYQFSGVNIADQTDSIYYDKDVLEREFGVKESEKKYTTMLTPQTYLSLAYKLNNNTKLSITTYAEFFRGIRPAASFAVIQRVGRVLNVIATYTVKKHSAVNLGGGLMVKPGCIQLYVVGDNFLGIANPFNSTSFNLRFGCNLVFGKIKSSDQQTYNAKK